MRQLSPHEQRTVRLAAIGIGIYLALFGGFVVYKRLAAAKADYRKLVAEAVNLRTEIRPYQDKVDHARRLMEGFHMDPMTLARTSLVAQASAAIQKASEQAGMAAGPIRESPSQTAKDAASIQFETTGPVTAVLALLHTLKSTGFPLIIDSMQLTPDSRRPGNLKLTLTIVILDFDSWKQEGQTNA